MLRALRGVSMSRLIQLLWLSRISLTGIRMKEQLRKEGKERLTCGNKERRSEV